nr:3-keto-5-aminohexanoate cleavage protein [Microbacterium sp. BR1]
MSARERPVIVTCAVTGAMHTPSMTPYLPITPEQILEAGLGAVEAGAAVLHLHAREPETGLPSSDPGLFRRFLEPLADQTDAVLNISTGAGPGMPMAQRLEAAETFQPELCSLNMGSLNFALHPILEAKGRDYFAQQWEIDFLEGSKDYVFRNTFQDIEHILGTLGRHGTRFEFECYDVGHLYTLAHFRDRGVITGPFFIQVVLGVLGGIGVSPENLIHLKSEADRLFGDDYRLSVIAGGRHQMAMSTMSAIIGGNVRVGIEDSLYLGRGELARTNAEQVAKIVRILSELSLRPAMPDEAREILALKGAAATRIGAA